MSEIIVVSDNEIEIIEVSEQGPAGPGTIDDVDFLDFNIVTGIPRQVGRMKWNDSVKTPEIDVSDNVTLQIGHENLIYVRNNSGSDIVNGAPVYLYGATGSVPTIRLADASDYEKTFKTIGLATETIGNNKFGFVCTFGMVGDLNTNAFEEGDTLYLGATAGTITKTKPAYPNNWLKLGVCAYKHGTNGKVFFSPAIERMKLGDIPNSNYTAFKDNGFMVMFGAAKGWRDELNDILKIQNSGTGFSVNAAECCVDVIQGANLSDYLFQNVQLNHDRDLTANIYPHMHFWQTENRLPNFIIEYRWQKKNGSKITSWTRLAMNTLVETYVSGTLNQIATTASGIAVPVGTDISDIVQFRFYRDYGNASGLFTGITPHAGTISLLSFDVHILFDALGSSTQAVK